MTIKIKTTFRLVLIPLVLTLPFLRAEAHHSRANFDIDSTISMTGTVTNVRWRSPHVFWMVEVENADGQIENWTFEGHSISGLVGNGWEPDSVDVGDHVLVVANPNRNPDTLFGLLDYFQHDDGRVFYSFRPPEGVEAMGRDNLEPLQPSTDFTGTWTRQSDGTPEQALRAALIGSANAAPTGLPLTAAGEALIERFSPNNDPFLNCEPIGVPRIITWPYAIRWTREGDTLMMEKELAQQTRTVYFNQPNPPADYVPDELGYSTGRILEDGTLEIESTNFAPTGWGIVSGLDSSDQKHILEQYTLSDDGLMLFYTYTLTDPVYLTESLVASGRYRKIPDHEFTDQPCDIETSRQHLQFE